MANLFDYITWRGDLTFVQSPFNEVDNLAFCQLVFLDLTGIVPEDGDVSLAQAALHFFQGREDEKIRLGVLVPDEIPPLFREMAKSERYRNLRLSCYVNQVDANEEKQFSALTVDLGDGTKYIAFRGTDDTIVGWKENFNMSFLDAVPAQKEAAEYLGRIADSCAQALRVGGHSKGGNLAVYASMHAAPEVQERIIEVYNNDGPGFGTSVIALESYLRVRGKIRTIIPQSSTVGMLLEHEEEYEVVKSKALGPFQHDGFTWEVLGPGFIHLDTVTGGCRYFDKTVKSWADGLNAEQREQFVDALFAILESTGAKTLTELSTGRIKKLKAMIDAYRHLDKDTKDMLQHTLGLLVKESARLSLEKVLPPKPELAD